MMVEKEKKIKHGDFWKKIISMGVLGIILLSNSRTFGWANKNQSSNAIYEQGLDLISQMNELANSEIFLDLCVTSECKEMILEAFLECDYMVPISVYKVVISNKKLLDNLAWTEKCPLYMLSSSVKDVLIQNGINGWIARLNNESSEYIAASAILKKNKTFVNTDLEENTAYIYIYKSAIPVIVTFIPGEDNAVEAVGNYIFNEKIMSDDQGYIESYFGDISTKIDKIY